MAELPLETQVNYVGTSFGARIVTGSLHLQGGGSLEGYCLSRMESPRPPADVVLISAAMDSDWFNPGNRMGRALSQIGSLLLVNNGCDRMLKHYRFIYGWRCHNAAIGYSGLECTGCLGADLAKIHAIDACCIVGSKHGCTSYLKSAALLARMRPYVFSNDAF